MKHASHMLITNPRKQKLSIQVKDTVHFTDITIGTGEVGFVFFLPLSKDASVIELEYRIIICLFICLLVQYPWISLF